MIIRDTEKTNPRSAGIDAMPASEVLSLMLSEEASMLRAVEAALPDLSALATSAADAVISGGKVVYAGSGTSGRLGVLDASEVYPTFGAKDFVAVIAGGEKAVTQSMEGAEDDREAARQSASIVSSSDMVIGIAASGTTPFVLAFLERAKELGAAAWLLCCNPVDKPPFVDGVIVIRTGPEVIAGSTRLKAGTATKIALNMISTSVMIKLGHVYDGLMVDVVPTNEKLRRRAVGIVMSISGCSEEQAQIALDASGSRPKTAALMASAGLSVIEATTLLNKNGGSLRKALKEAGVGG